MPDILSKFIYFTSAKFTAEIVSSAFDKRSEKFNNKNYGIYYWINSYSDLWGRMLPKVFEVIYILVKIENGKQYPFKWFEDMKNLPVMRIRIAPASEARSIYGGGIIGSDTILIDFYKGVDLHNYDEKVKEWEERSNALGHDDFIDAKPIFGENIYSAIYSGDNIDKIERTLYEKINDFSILDKLIKINDNWDIYNLVLSDKVL